MTNSFSNNLDLCQCLGSGEKGQVALEESACILTKHEAPYRLPNHIGCLRRKQTHYCFLQTSLIRDCQWQYHKVDQSLTWMNLKIILYSRSEHHLLFTQTTIHRQHAAWHIYSTSILTCHGRPNRTEIRSLDLDLSRLLPGTRWRFGRNVELQGAFHCNFLSENSWTHHKNHRNRWAWLYTALLCCCKSSDGQGRFHYRSLQWQLRHQLSLHHLMQPTVLVEVPSKCRNG